MRRLECGRLLVGDRKAAFIKGSTSRGRTSSLAVPLILVFIVPLGIVISWFFQTH